jgi:hypothetical protein
MNRAWVLCFLFVVAGGCASSHGKRGVIGGPPVETHSYPEAVLEKDLPPPERPPVEIRVHVERAPRSNIHVYEYIVSNGTPYRITDLHIGLQGWDGANGIHRPPFGMTEDGRMTTSSYRAPAGWSLQFDGSSRALGSLTWTAQEKDAILPGESLSGFRVVVDGKDSRYERSDWFAIVTGEAGTYTGALVSAPSDAAPPGDPIDRLGRLEIAPRVSRGDVTIRYRTPKKARPIVAILDSRGNVVRKYPQDRRRLRERRLVWDRRDQEEREVPAGDYFVRVRYGFTERFGRITILR